MNHSTKTNYRVTITLLLFLITLVSRATDTTTDLQNLVQYWNSIHNNRNTDAFNNLYAKDVLFYGRYRSHDHCIAAKTKNLNEKFSQEIISPITVQFFSSGTARCSFVKQVTYKQVKKSYESYLLFKEEDGVYHITGESDLITDKTLHVQLDLGSELQTNRSNSLAIIGTCILGAGAFVIFFILRTRKRREIKKELVELNELYHEQPVEIPELLQTQPSTVTVLTEEKNETTPAISTSLILEKEVEVSNKDKGDAFEKYIVSLFDVQYRRFRIQEWRSDKMADTGLYALSNHFPDLVFDFKDDHHRYHKFAIECKWRSSLHNGGIEWAKDYQIKNYLDFERKKRIPVFVAIGLGGTPDEPEKLFLAPLKAISKYPFAFESTLKKFNRNPKQRFFYNPRQKKLS